MDVSDNKDLILTSPPQVFSLPTGGTKPPPTSYSIPDRFDRLPEKIGQIQNPTQKLMFNQFLSASRPIWPVYWLPVGLSGNRSVWTVTDQIQFFFFFSLNSNARKVY